MPRDKKPKDRRSARTQRSLSEALVDLIKEKRFDEITVQEVIDRADVGRSTFYSHFRDKEDLFQKDWERFLDSFAQRIVWEKAGTESFVPVIYLFSHLKEFQPFYKGLVRSQKTDAVFKSGLRHLSQSMETTLTIWLASCLRCCNGGSIATCRSRQSEWTKSFTNWLRLPFGPFSNKAKVGRVPLGKFLPVTDWSLEQPVGEIKSDIAQTRRCVRFMTRDVDADHQVIKVLCYVK